MRMLRMLVVALLAVGTTLGPFALGSGGAVESSSAQRDALRSLNDVSTNLARLQRLHARMVALDGKTSALYRTLSAKVASVAKLAASAGTSRSTLVQQVQTLGDLSDQQQLVIQQAMSQKDTFEETFSNLLKTMQDTTKGIISNMKK